MLKITAMDEFLDDVKSYNTNRNVLLYKIIMLLTIAKVQLLNKPYIHYIDIKRPAGNHWTDILIRQQETTELPYNDMFIKMLTWTLLTKGFIYYWSLESITSVHIKMLNM